MGIEYNLDGVRVYISKNTTQKLRRYVQGDSSKVESGGLLVGRANNDGDTHILDITTPSKNDLKACNKFIRKCPSHKEKLNEFKKDFLYFKGNWHTHYENIPSPSEMDIKSWKNSLKMCDVGKSIYVVFIIIGIKRMGLWYGKINGNSIREGILVGEK